MTVGKTKDPKDYPVFRVVDDDDYEGKYDLLFEGGVEAGDIYGRKYKMVTQTLSDTDFYQGINMVSVIQNDKGELFGYFYFDDISKHGETYIESNGDEYGFESEEIEPEDDDEDEMYVSYYVFVPVEEYSIPSYRLRNA